VAQCYTCRREYERETDIYWNTHGECPECRRLRRKDLQEIKREVLDRIYEKFPCCVCGESDPDVLVLHHIDQSTKFRNEYSVKRSRGSGGRRGISELVSDNHSLRKLIEEVNKCAMVCSNCHQKVHKGKVLPEQLVQLNLPLPELRNRWNGDTYKQELDVVLQ
jgi:hypothetical protein